MVQHGGRFPRVFSCAPDPDRLREVAMQARSLSWLERSLTRKRSLVRIQSCLPYLSIIYRDSAWIFQTAEAGAVKTFN